MSTKPEPTVLGSLPRSRPQRRSDKRGARPEPAPAAAAKQPRPAPPKQARKQRDPAPQQQHAGRPPHLPDGAELVTTAVKATAELAEIGLTVGTRALRAALSRLPRP